MDKPTQMLTLRIPSALARRLDAKAPAGERSAFVARAIERAFGGDADYDAGYQAGYKAGSDRSFNFMYERSRIDRDCYWDALHLVRNGMDVVPAVRKAFEENPGMREYEALVKAGRAKEDKS